MDERELPIMVHVNELRTRLIQAMLGVAVAMGIAFAFSEFLLAWLRKPMQEAFGPSGRFVVLVPHEYFVTQMKTALVFGILFASPWLFYQLWLFVAPGLYRNEQRMAVIFVSLASILFVGGALFGYAVVFPPMFSFFIGTLPPGVEGTYSIGMLFGFATNMLLAFGLVFETPMVVLLLVKMDLIELDTLRKGRRYWVVLAFVIAAIVTPTPDPLTQTMMAVPMVLLYELGLWGARFLGKSANSAI